MLEIPNEHKVFLNGNNVSYLHFCHSTKYIYRYLLALWEIIQPTGNVLSMGIGRKTPKSIRGLLNFSGVTITHVELDDPQSVNISPRESIIWQTDFLNFLINQSNNSVRGIIFWHGPEHMEKANGEIAIQEALRVASDWVVIGCPWDRLKGWRGRPMNKEHLGHKSIWTENDLVNFGFQTISMGERNVYPGLLMGWKRKT